MSNAHDPKVQFTFSPSLDRYIPEAELADAAGWVKEKIIAQANLEGSIDIVTETGLIRIVDELIPWVQNLCFDAPVKLLESDTVQVGYFSRPGQIQLATHDGMVDISGDHIDPGRMAQDTLCAALIACGDRFLEFATKAKGADPDYMSQVDYVRRFQAKAHDAFAE